jgi:hypothetical protein
MTDAPGSHEHPSTTAVRSSALELLGSGNSLESVAHVFGVPVETLREWAANPPHPAASPPPPRAVTRAQAPPPAAAPTVQRTTFPKTATYRMGVMGRFAAFALVPLLLAGPVFSWPLVFDGTNNPGGVFVLVLAAAGLTALAACAIRYALNARFVLSPYSITGYRLGDGVTLALSRIEAVTATRLARSTSYTIVLHGMAGARSLTIYPEDRHLRDGDLYEWLTSIPTRGSGAIRQPTPASKTPVLLQVVMVLLGLVSLSNLYFLARGPIDDARALAAGYPPLERLSLTEGTLSHVSRCHPGGRSYSAYLPVTIATSTGPVAESLPCNVEAALRAPPGPHQLAVWRDKRPFSDGGVREVDVDGHAVQSYADYIARHQRFAPFSLAGALMLMATLVLFACGFIASSREHD